MVVDRNKVRTDDVQASKCHGLPHPLNCDDAQTRNGVTVQSGEQYQNGENRHGAMIRDDGHPFIIDQNLLVFCLHENHNFLHC